MPAAPLPHEGCSSPHRGPTFLHTGLSFLPIPAEILQANDNLTQVINLYKQLVRGEEVNGDAAAGSIPGEEAGTGDWEGAPRLEGAESRVVHWSQSRQQ